MDLKKLCISLATTEDGNDIIKIDNKLLSPPEKRSNSLKRIEHSYNYMLNGIKEASDEDLIILSDNDEIPNLDSPEFKNSEKDLFVFRQLFFYYKFNLFYDLMPWFGSKACKKKKLKSFSWLRNIKNKKYPFWRLDTHFSDLKNINIEIINNGGWHFTNVKSAFDLFIKMKNFGHHDEFDVSGLTLENISQRIKDKTVFYNHFLDQTDQDKWGYSYKLKKIDYALLPNYLTKNKEKYKEWFDL